MIAYANYFTDARIKNYVDALLRHGYEVDVFALGRPDHSGPPGLRVFSVMQKYWGGAGLHYATSQLWFALRVALLVGWRFREKQYGLIHVHNMPNFLVFSAIVPKLFGAKTILDVHDTMPEAYATKFNLPLAHPLIKLLRWEERLSAKFADHVITTNELHQEVLCSHGIPSEKIDIILNVGNERLFQPVLNVPAAKEKQMTIVYHGTIAERLGIDLILRAVCIASEQCPTLRLLLIGEGDFLPMVKDLIKKWKLASMVDVVGFVPVEALPAYLSQAEVGIVGNRAYTEAKQNYMLPVKMLEYAAMEIPAIAPRLHIIHRYFDEDSAIFYTPDNVEEMAQRIIEVYQHREILINVKQHLRLFNQRYNWSTMEIKYLSRVQRLLGAGLQPKVD